MIPGWCSQCTLGEQAMQPYIVSTDSFKLKEMHYLAI